MNAQELLEIMRAGGKVRAQWKPNWRRGRRRQYILTYPDGTKRVIQHSCMAPLIRRGLVRSYSLPSGSDDYRLVLSSLKIGTRIRFPQRAYWHFDKPPIPAGTIAIITDMETHPNDRSFNSYTLRTDADGQFVMYEWLLVQVAEEVV